MRVLTLLLLRFVNRDRSAAMNIAAKGVYALTHGGEGHPSLRRNFQLVVD